MQVEMEFAWDHLNMEKYANLSRRKTKTTLKENNTKYTALKVKDLSKELNHS